MKKPEDLYEQQMTILLLIVLALVLSSATIGFFVGAASCMGG
jgi:hypothetical protein